jgi:hypothetical protein
MRGLSKLVKKLCITALPTSSEHQKKSNQIITEALKKVLLNMKPAELKEWTEGLNPDRRQ